MLHSKHITVPANTSASSPQITRFKVNKGVMYRSYLNFPPGCAGLVQFRMSLEGSPILPVEKDAYIIGDGIVFEYPLYVEIAEEPMEIVIETVNLDDTYDHSLDLQLLIVDKQWVLPVGAYEGIIAALKSIFTRRF